MTNKCYTITSGPGRDDLLAGLSNQKILWFKGFADDTKQPHMFKVRVTNLGLPIQTRERLSWSLKGCITEKNGKPPTEFERCWAYFDSHERQGRFYEEEIVKPYTYEHLVRLDDNAIRVIVARFKKYLPGEIRRLDEYSRALAPRERLILEALHTKALSDACVGVEIAHQFELACKESGL